MAKKTTRGSRVARKDAANRRAAQEILQPSRLKPLNYEPPPAPAFEDGGPPHVDPSDFARFVIEVFARANHCIGIFVPNPDDFVDAIDPLSPSTDPEQRRKNVLEALGIEKAYLREPLLLTHFAGRVLKALSEAPTDVQRRVYAECMNMGYWLGLQQGRLAISALGKDISRADAFVEGSDGGGASTRQRSLEKGSARAAVDYRRLVGTTDWKGNSEGLKKKLAEENDIEVSAIDKQLERDRKRIRTV